MSELLDSFTPEFLGIVWVTSGPISRERRYFNEVNYLLDGLLLNSFEVEPNKNENHFELFVGKNFGRDFFLAHMVYEDQFPFQKIDKFYQIIRAHIQTERRKTILLGETSKLNLKDWDKLKRRFNNLEFVPVVDWSKD